MLFIKNSSTLDVFGELLNNSRLRFPDVVKSDGEIKGGDLPDDEILLYLEALNAVKGPLFHSQPILSYESAVSAFGRKAFRELLEHFEARRERRDGDSINARYERLRSYVDKLKPINAHKLASMCVHLNRFWKPLRDREHARDLRSLKITVDRENFPQPKVCASVIKTLAASGVQWAGMHHHFNGNSMNEEPCEGAIQADAAGNSSEHVGLQVVDILIQGRFRELPGFCISDDF